MIKTEFYIAGGTTSHMLTDIPECTKLTEISGLLYNNDRNLHKSIWCDQQMCFTRRIVMAQEDVIDQFGITRRIVFSL
jgi:hypothetical protein